MVCALPLTVLRIRDEGAGAQVHVPANVILIPLIHVVEDQIDRYASLGFIAEPRMPGAYHDVLQFLRKVTDFHSVCVDREPHGVILDIHQVVGIPERLFQIAVGFRAGQGLLHRLQRIVPAAGHFRLLKIVVHVIRICRNDKTLHALRQIIGSRHQILSAPFHLDIPVRRFLQDIVARHDAVRGVQQQDRKEDRNGHHKPVEPLDRKAFYAFVFAVLVHICHICGN